MKSFCGLLMLCTLILFAFGGNATAQTMVSSNTSTEDASITAISVIGVVTDLKLDLRQVTVKTNAGNQVIVMLSDRTEFMRIPPGEKTKDKFIKLTGPDFGVGDSVFARGRMSDRKNLSALEFYVMSKGDIAQKKEREREQWRARGIVGPVVALNPETKEITLTSRSPEGPKAIIIATKEDTRFRRYAPDSVKFSDAKSSSFAELKVGDQLRALGSKSTDGERFIPEEIVSGSFQTIGGTITAISPQNNEIKINDLLTSKPLTIVISKDSRLSRLTPEAIAILAPLNPTSSDSGRSTAVPSPSPSKATKSDLQEMLDQLPTLTIHDLKPGEMVLISSTKGSEPTRVTSIAVISGVGPLLQANQGGRPNAVALGAMNLGGIGGP